MSTDPDDWDPRRDKAIRYQHQRAQSLPHWIVITKGFRRHIHWEERRDCIVIYLDVPMEDEYSESYMVHPKVRQWLTETVPDRDDWTYHELTSTIRFRHKHHAMMFKLTFSDGVVR